MSNLLSAQFWFNQYPDPLIPSTEKLLIGIIIVFAAAAIACYILKNRKDFYQILYGKVLGLFVFNAIVGALICFFDQQMIPFLSARLWFVIWGIEMIVWAALIIVYARKLPAKKQKMKEEKEFKKYIP